MRDLSQSLIVFYLTGLAGLVLASAGLMKLAGPQWLVAPAQAAAAALTAALVALVIIRIRRRADRRPPRWSSIDPVAKPVLKAAVTATAAITTAGLALLLIEGRWLWPPIIGAALMSAVTVNLFYSAPTRS